VTGLSSPNNSTKRGLRHSLLSLKHLDRVEEYFFFVILNKLDRTEHYVVQRYMHKPYLIDDLKFDLRIFVLLVGVNPLRAFIYKEGMARFAVEQYCSPNIGNLKNLYMHLTNYAINKDHEDYEEGDGSNTGHKRYMSYIFDHLDENEGPNKVWENIKDLINKALITVQPSLSHAYRT
jgi:tubulin polyglutamylase TTLL6/13